MEDKLVICVGRNDKYKHHRKLKIGEKYIMHKNNSKFLSKKHLESFHSSIIIKKINGDTLGHYPENLFIDVSKHRESVIDNIIS